MFFILYNIYFSSNTWHHYRICLGRQWSVVDAFSRISSSNRSCGLHFLYGLERVSSLHSHHATVFGRNNQIWGEDMGSTVSKQWEIKRLHANSWCMPKLFEVHGRINFEAQYEGFHVTASEVMEAQVKWMFLTREVPPFVILLNWFKPINFRTSFCQSHPQFPRSRQ